MDAALLPSVCVISALQLTLYRLVESLPVFQITTVSLSHTIKVTFKVLFRWFQQFFESVRLMSVGFQN